MNPKHNFFLYELPIKEDSKNPSFFFEETKTPKWVEDMLKRI